MLMILLPLSHKIVGTAIVGLAIVIYLHSAYVRAQVAKAEAAVRLESGKILQNAKSGVAAAIADVRNGAVTDEAKAVITAIENRIKKLL